MVQVESQVGMGTVLYDVMPNDAAWHLQYPPFAFQAVKSTSQSVCQTTYPSCTSYVVCEVTEECPSVIGSSLYICDASERRTRWCRPAFLFFSFSCGTGVVGEGIQFPNMEEDRPRRHVCAAAWTTAHCRLRNTVPIVCLRSRNAWQRTTPFFFFFFALLAVFRRDRFARGVEKRSLSWGHCLYDISMCDTFRVYLYTMCVSVSVPLRVAQRAVFFWWSVIP